MAVADWTTDPYPKPRAARGTASGAPAAAPESVAPLAPRTRLWNFHIHISGNSNGQVTSPRFRGPGVLKDMTGSYVLDGADAASEVHVQILIATAKAISTAAAGVATNYAGTNIIEQDWLDVNLPKAVGGRAGLNWRHDGGSSSIFDQKLGYVVYEAEFYVTIALRNNHSTNPARIDGCLRVFEDCDPDALVLLMG